MRDAPVSALERSPAALLYQEHAATLFAYLRGQTATREDAEDALLEVFLAALEDKRLATLPAHEQLAWLRGVARYKVADLYRRSYRRPAVSLEEVQETLEEETATP